MSSQIFKKVVPTNVLFDLLDKISIKNDKCYILNKLYFS